jgi:ppGpp synthetase/RelA/SpoT-type nucleotidyltranferase
MQNINPKKYSKKQVNKAGNILKQTNPTTKDKQWAEEVLTNWRGSHFYPINTFRSTLTQKLKGIDSSALVAQRIKRTPSIIDKLERIPKMNLARMQDIGGLRAVLKDINKVRQLEKNYLNSNFKHEKKVHKDYINAPKESGYRGIHLIYKYNNTKVLDYNGLHIELQIRTKLQHIWATAVETVGTFLDSPLKSSKGPGEWLDFFALISSAFAIIEGTPKVPKFAHLDDIATFKEVIKKANELNVAKYLKTYSKIVNNTSASQGSHHLIILDVDKNTVETKNYGRRRLDQANNDYTKYEEEINQGKNINIVLVSTSSIEALKKAYPNYFLDTSDFLVQLKNIEKKIK